MKLNLDCCNFLKIFVCVLIITLHVALYSTIFSKLDELANTVNENYQKISKHQIQKPVADLTHLNTDILYAYGKSIKRLYDLNSLGKASLFLTLAQEFFK